MKIYFSTVRRNAIPEHGGEIVSLDWDHKTVLNSVTIQPTAPEIVDSNYGSSSRGGRGMIFHDNQVIVASFHSLLFFDFSLTKVLKTISHPKMVGIHEIELVEEDKVKVTCTSIDAILIIDLHKGEIVNEFWPLENEVLQGSLQVHPMEINKGADLRHAFLTSETCHMNRLHINATARWKDKDIVLCPKQQSIVAIETGEVIFAHSKLQGAHNLVPLHDSVFVVNASPRREIIFVDLDKKEIVKSIDLLTFEVVKKWFLKYRLTYGISRRLWQWRLTKKRPSFPVFARGLVVYDDLLFVGVSPAGVLCINYDDQMLVDYFQYSRDVSLCVHGLAVAQ